MVGGVVGGAFVALVAANFAYLYPVLTALADGLGDGWDARTEEAWRAAYALIAEVMMTAGEQARAAVPTSRQEQAPQDREISRVRR